MVVVVMVVVVVVVVMMVMVGVAAVVIYHKETLCAHLSPVTTTSSYRVRLQETVKIHSPTNMLNLFQSTLKLEFKQKPRNISIFIRNKFLKRLVFHIVLQKCFL